MLCNLSKHNTTYTIQIARLRSANGRNGHEEPFKMRRRNGEGGSTAEARVEGSHLPTILDESCECPDLVVERPRRGIRLTCVPVDPARSRGFGAHTDGFDQSPTYAPAARSLNRKHVLQIADGTDLCGRAMEEVVHEADQRFSLFGEQRMHRLKAVEEAAPSHLRHVHRHLPAGLILLPKRLPARAVLRFGVSDDERGTIRCSLGSWAPLMVVWG